MEFVAEYFFYLLFWDRVYCTSLVALNLIQKSTCLCFPTAGFKVVCCHTWQVYFEDCNARVCTVRMSQSKMLKPDNAVIVCSFCVHSHWLYFTVWYSIECVMSSCHCASCSSCFFHILLCIKMIFDNNFLSVIDWCFKC